FAQALSHPIKTAFLLQTASSNQRGIYFVNAGLANQKGISVWLTFPALKRSGGVCGATVCARSSRTACQCVHTNINSIVAEGARSVCI
ncbi:hypothetical protein ANANG_G00279670, partial [Anguilla anguilla]